MKPNSLTNKQKLVLYGLNKYPTVNNKELSALLKLSESTVATIRNRLLKEQYFYPLNIPMLNRFGCELLCIVITQYNSLFPYDRRKIALQDSIGFSEEEFLSIEERDYGVSFSIYKNYTDFISYNESRTEKLGKLGLVDEYYPELITFPLYTSKVRRFFDYWRLLESSFSINQSLKEIAENEWFTRGENFQMNEKERKVFIALIEGPRATLQTIGDWVGLSRYTISRMKKKFFDKGWLNKLLVPNLLKLNLNILIIYIIKFNAKNIPKEEDIDFLDSKYSLFFVYSKLKAVIISAYENYNEYKEDMRQKVTFLKETNISINMPLIKDISVERMEITRGFIFGLFLRRILDVELPVFPGEN